MRIRGAEMLAQNFMRPADLGLNDRQFDALVKTLKLLETNKLQHVIAPGYRFETPPAACGFDGVFNMAPWISDSACGTVACIGGTACLLAGDPELFHGEEPAGDTDALFFPPHYVKSNKITTEQAARALRSYLTTGDPKWTEAVAC
jgi:hypothetical protein